MLVAEAQGARASAVSAHLEAELAVEPAPPIWHLITSFTS
jgi:hypothetical protein